MKYFSLKEPRDAVQIYAHYSGSNDFNLAQSPEVFAGKVIEGEEDHFDDDGNRLKSYGIGLFYNALYVPVDKASIIEDQLAGSGVDFYTAKIMTLQGEYVAFRSFNLFDALNPVPMCRRLHPNHDDFLYIKQYFSEEFLDFLSEHFHIQDFYRISLPETKDKDS